MTVTTPEQTAKDDWQRVEHCLSFAGSIYWPAALLWLLPDDAEWWMTAGAGFGVLVVIAILRKRHGLRMLWSESNAA